MGATEDVLMSFQGKGFIPNTSNLEDKGGPMPISDLRQLNKFLKKTKLCMVALTFIILSLNVRDWYAALNLGDTIFM